MEPDVISSIMLYNEYPVDGGIGVFGVTQSSVRVLIAKRRIRGLLIIQGCKQHTGDVD